MTNNKQQKLKEFLIKNETEECLENNKAMVRDIEKLIYDALMFKVMWGIPISVVIDEDAIEKGKWQELDEVDYQSIVNELNGKKKA